MTPTDSELEIIANRVFDRDIPVDVLRDWLGQFKPDEQPFLLTLVENFDYFSLARTKVLLRKLHTSLSAELGEDVDKTVIVPIGYAAMSGGTIAHLYRVENSLPQNIFVASSEIPWIDTRRVKNIVFIDDFIGSGNQGMNLWNHLTGSVSSSKLREWTLWYAVVVGSEEGIVRISKGSRFRVLAAHTIDENQSPLAATATTFTPEQRAEVLSILKQYGERLFPTHPLGFARSQSFIGFFYSTPNNTLPIFWANHNGWKPLLPHGDTHREPAYLLSPLAKAGIYGEASTIPQVSIDDDASMSSLLIKEFKTLRKAQIVAPALQSLGIREQVFTKVMAALRTLAFDEHEHRPITCSLILVSDSFEARTFPEYPLYASFTMPDREEAMLEEVAELSDAFNSGVVVKASGEILGLMSYHERDNYIDEFLPPRYRKLASTSGAALGLGFFVAGKSHIDIFWNGQRVLQHRNANWYEPYSKLQLEAIAAEWAQSLGVKQKVLNYCLALATKMIDEGEGALIVIGDTDRIIDEFADTKRHGLSFGDHEVFLHPIGGIQRIVSQDGATLIDNAGRIRDFMVTIKLPPRIEVERESRKGTKHDTAAKLSKLCDCICFAISVDKCFSIYRNGKMVLRTYG
jgi:hypothetical protein